MAGGESSDRVETRSTSAKTPSTGNKLGFVRTTGTGKRRSNTDPVPIRASGPQKRKIATDPEPRESARQKMSSNENSTPSSSATTGGKSSKLPLKPSKLVGTGSGSISSKLPANASASNPNPLHTGGSEPPDESPKTGRSAQGPNNAGDNGEEDEAGLSLEFRLAIKILERKLGGKIDELKESLDGRVSKLENKLDNVEIMLEERDNMVDELSKKVDLIPVDINRGIATAMAKETGAIAAEMKELKERQTKIEHKLAAGTSSMRSAAEQTTSAPEHVIAHSNKYWEARKCAKMSPIDGKSEGELREGVKNFIYQTLLVDEAEFSMESVVAVRKVKSFGASSVKDECVVIFSDVERRDLVYSHARNLATQTLQGGSRNSKLRMQIPAHLLECFRTLDKHGHLLKLRYEKKGIKIKRHINYDDESESLYLDVKISKDDPWERIYPDYARDERRRREKKAAAGRDRRDRLSSTVGSSSDDGGSGDNFSERPSGFTQGKRPR